MTDKADIERRTLLRAITAASSTALSSALLSRRAAAAPIDKATSAASDHFETAEIKIGDNTIFIRRYGNGSPLLMVHGFPRTSLMWRHMAPQFASYHTVICADLRGYGRSGVPASAEDHYPYTKRAMANELVAMMDKLGFSKFDLVGHDRVVASLTALRSIIHRRCNVSQCLMSSRSQRDGVTPMQSSP
jgi:haloacetate dehalogenase